MCSTANDDQMVRAAIEHGLDAIVFTDHNRLVPPARIEELNREFSKLQNEFEKMKETYERQQLLFTEKRKQEEQRSLGRKQEELQRFMKEVTDPERGKLALKQQELSAPIHAHVNEVVQKVAKEKGYDFVLNTIALVYANEEHDLTEAVLEELQKGSEEQAQKTGPRR